MISSRNPPNPAGSGETRGYWSPPRGHHVTAVPTGPRRYCVRVGSVDDLLASADEPQRAALQRVLDLAAELAPEAEQGTSYGLPALRLGGKPLLGFNIASAHLAVYPFSPAAVDAAREFLVGGDASKGAVRFTPGAPLPDDAVRALVTTRRDEIIG